MLDTGKLATTVAWRNGKLKSKQKSDKARERMQDQVKELEQQLHQRYTAKTAKRLRAAEDQLQKATEKAEAKTRAYEKRQQAIRKFERVMQAIQVFQQKVLPDDTSSNKQSTSNEKRFLKYFSPDMHLAALAWLTWEKTALEDAKLGHPNEGEHG